MSRMLEGTPCPRGHDRAWNVTDVRDCGEIHALIAESSNTRNGQRYLCCAADDSGLLNIFQLQAKLCHSMVDRCFKVKIFSRRPGSKLLLLVLILLGGAGPMHGA